MSSFSLKLQYCTYVFIPSHLTIHGSNKCRLLLLVELLHKIYIWLTGWSIRAADWVVHSCSRVGGPFVKQTGWSSDVAKWLTQCSIHANLLMSSYCTSCRTLPVSGPWNMYSEWYTHSTINWVPSVQHVLCPITHPDTRTNHSFQHRYFSVSTDV